MLDLRSLALLDVQGIVDSVKTRSKVLILHEDTQNHGFAGEICSIINEHAFEWLDAPIKRLTAPNTPVPYHAQLESVFAPSVETIVQAVDALAHY